MDAKIKSLWEKLMSRYDVPKLVFSVFGDSETFVPKVWPRPIFQSALIAAAKHSGGDTWILFRGKENGVTSLILELFDTYRQLENRRLGDNNKKKANSFPVKAIRLNFGDDVKEESGTKLIPDNLESVKVEELEDHIECTILDTTGDFEDIHLQFECFIQEQIVAFLKEKRQNPSNKRKLKLELPIPVVRVLVEGDLKSVDEIVESVKRNIPVVIVKGSGKTADLILDYIEKPKSLKSNAALLFGIRFRSETFKKLRKGLKELESSEHLINVFDVEKHKAEYFLQVTGEAIVRARAYDYFQNKGINLLLKAKDENNQGQIKKPVAFNYQDVKNENSQRSPTRNEKGKQIKMMPASLPLFFYFGYQVLQEKGKLLHWGHILLFEALRTNRCDYVKVLVSEGVKFKETYIAKLYKETFPSHEETWQFFKKEDLLKIKIRSDSVLSFTNGQLVQEKPQYEKMEKKEKKKQKIEEYNAVSRAVQKLCCYLLQHDDPDDSAKEQQLEDKYLLHMDLLLWAIFAQREEIAGYFWLHGENNLVSSLICTVLLGKLSKMSADKKEYNLSKRFENHARLFEKRAVLLLDAMYEEDEKCAMAALDQEVTVFGIKTTPLSFAYENLMYDVLGHPCSQHRMDLIWQKKAGGDVDNRGCCPACCSIFDLSPKTFFAINYVMFLVALLTYSVFVLTSVSNRDPCDIKVRAMEYSVYVWGLGDFIEEYRPIMELLILIPRRKFRRFFFKLKLHVNDFWNSIDLVWYICVVLAIILRETGFEDGIITFRQFFAGSLLLMYLRFLLAFMMIRTFGTTLIMIKEMLKDLLVFIWVAAFVLLGVGTYYHTMIWPDDKLFFERDSFIFRIWNILYLAYWQIFGETNRDSFIDLGAEWTVYLIAGLYMMFTNILLVNLVIAMFSHTFGRVKANSEKLWMFERYVVIKDFERRKPSLINVVCFVRYIICFLCRKRTNRTTINSDELEKNIKDEKKERISNVIKFQKIMAKSVVYSQDLK